MEKYVICNIYSICNTCNIYNKGVKNMEDIKILDLVDYVNKNLNKGLSTANIEKQLLKTGKDTLRKKLNRYNYFYNKELNQYVLGEKKELVNINTKPIALKEKQEIKTEENLTIEEIKILREIIKNYKAENKEVAATLDLEGEVVVRSIRTYKKVLDLFSSYCKKRDLNQKDSLSKALIFYMENN